jgi:hypothetical protein
MIGFIPDPGPGAPPAVRAYAGARNAWHAAILSDRWEAALSTYIEAEAALKSHLERRGPVEAAGCTFGLKDGDILVERTWNGDE